MLRGRWEVEVKIRGFVSLWYLKSWNWIRSPKGLRLVLWEEGGTSRGEGKKPVRKASKQSELYLRDKGGKPVEKESVTNCVAHH